MLRFIFTLIIFPFFSLLSFGQNKAFIKKDTAFYAGRTFAAGDTIMLAYGSGPAKEFIFVGIGSQLLGWEQLTSDMAKTQVLIEKVLERNKKVAVRGKVIGKRSGTMSGKTVNIDLEAAVDNKEIF